MIDRTDLNYIENYVANGKGYPGCSLTRIKGDLFDNEILVNKYKEGRLDTKLFLSFNPITVLFEDFGYRCLHGEGFDMGKLFETLYKCYIPVGSGKSLDVVCLLVTEINNGISLKLVFEFSKSAEIVFDRGLNYIKSTSNLKLDAKKIESIRFILHCMLVVESRRDSDIPLNTIGLWLQNKVKNKNNIFTDEDEWYVGYCGMKYEKGEFRKDYLVCNK